MVPPTSELLARRSSGDEAALHIRRLIFDGELRPGMRVPQAEVAESLGISRIPVREALIALEHEGWVVTELHRGAFINTLDERAVRDHYDLYGLVYGFATRRALERCDPVELGVRLTVIASAMSPDDDARSFEQRSLAFHDAIVDAAASPRIRVVLRALSSMVPGNFFRLVPDATRIQCHGTAAIARAITIGDGARAAEAYAAMLHELGEQVVKLFASRGLIDGEPGDSP